MKPFPVLVQALLEGIHITQVQCGGYHIMALTSSGYVFTWGSSSEHSARRLGDGKTTLNDFTISCRVEELREHDTIAQISSYHHHSASVLLDPNLSPICQSQQNGFNKNKTPMLS
jgi:alpha-tubulin suppressor-like RCC1 family protein